MRFNAVLKNRSRLLSYLDAAWNREIGCMAVQELSLVIHDWYNRKKEEIETFILRGK